MPTMYDRNGPSGQEPQGAQGQYNIQGDQQGHSTQYYSDGTRYSWDTNGATDQDYNQHWTNQNVGKHHPDRHTPPGHAR